MEGRRAVPTGKTWSQGLSPCDCVWAVPWSAPCLRLTSRTGLDTPWISMDGRLGPPEAGANMKAGGTLPGPGGDVSAGDQP